MKQANCRIIAATNQNLLGMIANNQFREDLYYRLNVINLVIPPLRMRKEDIYELTQTFLQEFSLLYNRHIELLPSEVFKMLFSYDWPGNVRELRNVIERIAILTTDGEVRTEYLPESLTASMDPKPSTTEGNMPLRSLPARSSFHSAGDAPDTSQAENEGLLFEVSPLSYKKQMDAYESELLLQCLETVGGNKRLLAKQLGISRATLYNRMKRLGL